MKKKKKTYSPKNLLDLTTNPSVENIEFEIKRLTEELKAKHSPTWNHFTSNTSRINLYQNELSRRIIAKSSRHATIWSALAIIVSSLAIAINFLIK